MTDTELLSYIGAISGVIGAITGLAGATVAHIGYKKTEHLKALDLRIELRKAISDLMNESDDLEDLIDRASKSRNAVSAATGTRQSGAMERWNAQLSADKSSLKTVQAAIVDLNCDYSTDSPAKLEKRIVETHVTRAITIRLHKSYSEAICKDDRERDNLREDMRSLAKAGHSLQARREA